MGEEVRNINEVKTTSDGDVKISLEKYNELVRDAARKPAVINHTQVVRTPEMLARDCRVWGGTLMGLGLSMFIVGGALYMSGRS